MSAYPTAAATSSTLQEEFSSICTACFIRNSFKRNRKVFPVSLRI